ncbi:MAG: cation-translocating P-type ATPase [Ruminococcaceae bacterium]|nr:cation-translocating P-type ATPase [Oscillospiraceae bacterium]
MWYNKSLKELYSELGSSRAGLTESQAKERLIKYGKNELLSKKKKSFLRRYFEALCDRMTVVLLIAAAISFATSYLSGEGYADPIIILIIVLVNGLIAVIQESRAEKALEALKKMTSPECRALRDGTVCRIPSSELVPGDVFLLEKGDIVPCDALLIESNELLVDESSLTGESLGVMKNHRTAASTAKTASEAANAVFSSSFVLTGRGTALAVRTGMSSCVGEIAGMISVDSEKTPLQKRLAKLSALLGNITIGICLLIFAFSLIKGMDIGEMFMTSVSLSVAAIPEGLPAIVTVVLSAGVQTMARRKAVVKRLPAVETLGCAGVICSDKTGTLTCNKMTVNSLYGDESELLTAFALCNNDSSPTELALSEYCKNAEEVRKRYPRVAEIPFDSIKKYMVTANKTEKGYVVYIKGAPDVVAEFLGNSFFDIESHVREMTAEALRVMCFAKYETESLPADLLSKRFSFIGLCGISDPPRPEAAEAVRICKRAGIRVVMITGDHPDTAYAIARKIGICEKNARVCTERELSSLSDREFSKAAEQCNVFARVTPGFKLKIVTALKSRGNVVAMTGDGVNDAPALKRADIGCAMGISGTEVAKESADMILADDNFSTVVEAVKEGRGIYDNIKRAVHFLLSCNIGELFTVFLAIILSLPSPLSAIQLLWVNLTTDSLPAIALGLERASESVMLRPPIKPNQPLFSASRTARIIFEGILIGTLAISAFAIGSSLSGFATGRTMCFFVLAASQLFHSFNMRSEKSVFARGKKKNPFVLLAFFVCFALIASVIVIPSASSLFGVVSLSAYEWLISLALSVCPLAVCEVYKMLIK